MRCSNNARGGGEAPPAGGHENFSSRAAFVSLTGEGGRSFPVVWEASAFSAGVAGLAGPRVAGAGPGSPLSWAEEVWGAGDLSSVRFEEQPAAMQEQAVKSVIARTIQRALSMFTLLSATFSRIFFAAEKG